jgi:MraZ protein
MPEPVSQKMTYDSLHRYAVDPNRRVQLPLPWRAPRKPVEFTMIVWPQHKCGPCLRVLPPEEMAKLRERIEAMPASEKTSLKRHIGSSSVRISMDGAKRLGIPEEMAAAIGLKDEAVFMGMLDYFEIWSPERHKEMIAHEQPGLARSFQLLE